MDPFQKSLILQAYPPGSRIAGTRSYRPGYMRYPVRVRVQLLDGQKARCVLKADSFVEGIRREAKLLPVLARLGLPVPSVLAGPVAHPGETNGKALLVLSEMPGRPLPWLRPTLAGADLTCRLHQQAIARLHQLTEPLMRDEISHELSKKTMRAELREIVSKDGPWLQVPLFAEAVRRLGPILDEIETPLVFSNGDYNPLNFLHVDGQLTGWIDFAEACFEDPLIGLAKFLIWGFDTLGWGTGVRAGLVERYLYSRNLSRSDFAPRLALRCLWYLQKDVSVAGESDTVYRQAALRALREALDSL